MLCKPLFWPLLFAGFAARLLGDAESAQEWEQFRKVYPFHFQTTAITAPAADGSRILIIAEPPPHVTLQGLTSLDPQHLAAAKSYKHVLGYDGWVKDVVVDVPPMKEADLRDLLDRVHVYLFGTTYKTAPLPLPATASAPTPVPIDARVAATDLFRWFVVDRLSLVGFSRPEATSIPDLLKQGKEGLYFGSKDGVVVWSLPRKGDYSRSKAEARQFAMASDLIIGAIAGPTHVAIIARERSTPLTILPPLRTETILQVADAT